MTIILKKTWQFINAADSAKRKERRVKVDVPAGEHQVEIITPNPCYSAAEDPNYLVLKGTLIGLGLEYLRSFAGEEQGINQVLIED